MNRRRVLGGAVAAILVVLVLVVLFRPTGGTAVEKSTAVDNFRRNHKTQVPGSPKGESSERNVGPQDRRVSSAGVYAYSASGREEMKLGPLPAVERVLPPEIVASVVSSRGRDSDESGGDNCFTFELNLFVEHVEKTRYCLERDALRIDQHSKSIMIGPMTAAADLSCDPKVLIVVDSPVEGRACKLKLSGGPITVDADFEGSIDVGPETQLEVGGTAVDVLPVTVSYLASGSVTGTWVERFWLASSDWLPVRIERDVALVGPANITEKSEFHLKSLEPAT